LAPARGAKRIAGENPPPQLDAQRRSARSVALDEKTSEVTGMNMAKATDPKTASASEVNAGHLKAFIERIERLEEEKKALAGDIKDVYGEAKANGFDVKIMRKIVSLRRQDRDSRIEEETILDLYLAALGMS
jgi:uncharacterized protein (UPF0335 family)